MSESSVLSLLISIDVRTNDYLKNTLSPHLTQIETLRLFFVFAFRSREEEKSMENDDKFLELPLP